MWHHFREVSVIQIALLGARGRMGQKVIHLLQEEYAGTASLTAQANRGDPFNSLLKADVIIDFSSSAAMQSLAHFAIEHSSHLPAFIVGSTGWNPEDNKILQTLAKKAPVLVASNFSAGVYLLGEILKEYAPIFEKLGYTPTLLEVHHRHKKDSPSGTAMTLQRLINPKHPEDVQTQSIRAGEVVGNHEVVFYGPNDHIKLAHYAQDRGLFARGAVEAALWLGRQKLDQPSLSGLFGLKDYFSALR